MRMLFTPIIFTKETNSTKKTMSRLQFMLSLHKELTEEWQRYRLTFPKINRELRTKIEAALGLGEKQIPVNENLQHGPRKYVYCSYKKKKIHNYILY